MRELHTAPRLAALLIGLFTLGVCVAASREQDPTVQKLTELDGRLLRIERVLNNQSLLDMAQRDDSLQNDLRALRGQLEELQHSVDIMRDQQRDMYSDLDKRMQALESGAAPAAAAPVTGAGGTASGGDAAAYQAAFDLLKNGKYSEAAAAFSKFLASYPQSNLADNGYYWLGETHYVLKDFPQATRDFQTVLDKYPDSRKTPDALLKLGYTQYELKSYKDARATLRRLVQQYADTSSAKLAQQRLAKMDAEGH
jgi:tol-pal system protein YbgF